MAELPWLLLALGVVVFGLVYWWSRREAEGRPPVAPTLFKRAEPAVDQPAGVASAEPAADDSSPQPAREPAGPPPDAIITVRMVAQNGGTFSGEALVLALRETGLRHGRFGIFHRYEPDDDQRPRFGVASLVEPGSFDLSRVKSERYPGVSLFLALPTGGDDVAAFDDMLSTARKLAASLDGEILDDRGSRLSVQRERYLREEVIRFRHRPGAS